MGKGPERWFKLLSNETCTPTFGSIPIDAQPCAVMGSKPKAPSARFLFKKGSTVALTSGGSSLVTFFAVSKALAAKKVEILKP